MEDAAKGDLTVARLTLGLFEAVLGFQREVLFPGYRGALLDCLRFPLTLQSDVRTLVDWALNPSGVDTQAIYACSKEIELRVRAMRSRSPLGRHFRRRAARLMRQNPQLPKAEWGPFGTMYQLMRQEIGRPLTERTVKSAAALKPQVLQIVPHDAYLNSTWTVGTLTIRINEDGYTVQDITLAVAQPDRTTEPLCDDSRES